MTTTTTTSLKSPGGTAASLFDSARLIERDVLYALLAELALWLTSNARSIPSDATRELIDRAASWIREGRKARGLSLGLGIGVGGFWANGEEVRSQVRTDLADFGFGVQGFVEFNWRARKFAAGIDVKYQVVTDILGIDYSNFRWGGHLGVVF